LLPTCRRLTPAASCWVNSRAHPSACWWQTRGVGWARAPLPSGECVSHSKLSCLSPLHCLSVYTHLSWLLPPTLTRP
jgi:hypothetical protein